MLPNMLVAIALTACVAAPQSRELLPNPSFDDAADGWRLHRAEHVPKAGRSGADAVLLHGPEKLGGSGLGFARVDLAGLAAGVRHEFSGSIRSRGPAGLLSLRVAATDEVGTRLGFKVQRALPRDAWQRVTLAFTLPEGVDDTTLTFFQVGGGDVLVSDASLRVTGDGTSEVDVTPDGQPASANLRGPGVIHAHASTCVRASEDGADGEVTFPIPIATATQVPLTFEAYCEPANALAGCRWVERDDGNNLLCVIEVSAPPGVDVQVGWRAHVLVIGDDRSPLPHAAEPDAPDEARPWLEPTACVQSDDPAIRAKAKELAREASDVESYATAVVKFTKRNRGDGETAFDALDARKALDCGGSCTSRANLCAALLRAHGIPARTQAHLPTWSGPLYEHWLVEYWHPGAGWTWLEPSRGQVRPPAWSLVAINIANPADEDRGFDQRIRHSGVMVGVPLFAVHDIAPPLVRGKKRVLNRARAVWPIEADRAATLWAGARAAFGPMRDAAVEGDLGAERTRRIVAAIEARELERLGEQLKVQKGL